MKIAVSATAPSASAPVEERFGRCACFVVFDENGNMLETIINEGAASAEGAGIRTARLLIDRGVNVVLTGRVGPKAMQALPAAGMVVYTGVAGTVAESLERYRQGRMQPLVVPNAGRHAGRDLSKRVSE